MIIEEDKEMLYMPIIVYKEAGKRPEIREVPILNLEPMQKMVGGHIEMIYFPVGDKEYDMFLNEEGKLEGLDPNLQFPRDTVVGNIFLCTADDEGQSIGITQEEAEAIVKELEKFHITHIPPGVAGNLGKSYLVGLGYID
jgi:hypothetical protein